MLVLQVFFRQIQMLNIFSTVLLPALNPACSSARISSTWGCSLLNGTLSMTLLGWLIRLIVWWFWQSWRSPFLGMVMTSAWFHGVGHFFVIHISLKLKLKFLVYSVLEPAVGYLTNLHLHMAVRALPTCSPPAWISSAVILSTPAEFPFFNAFTAISVASYRLAKSSFIGGGSL